MAIPADDVAMPLGDDGAKMAPPSFESIQDTLGAQYQSNKILTIVVLIIIVALICIGGTQLATTEDVTAGFTYLVLGVLGAAGFYWYAASQRVQGSGY